MRGFRKLFSTGSKPCLSPPETGRLPLFDIPTSPTFGGKKLFNDDGPQYATAEMLKPPKVTEELGRSWFIDENGFYAVKLPTVHPTRAHFKEADCEAFPHPLTLYRFALDRMCFERFKMNAYWVGSRLHHFIGAKVPGFWETFQYKYEMGDHKVFRLIFKEQGEIILYATHSGPTKAADGATLVMFDHEGNRTALLYDSPSADRDICYPEDQHLTHPSFTLPSRKTAKALVQIFAMVAAIPDAVAQEGIKFG